MPFIEAPTTFYLGRQFDLNTHKLGEDVVYYDARDLVTHAIVVGMTGSGKTGLCITMLEEAILDNIPAIIIDPKGDITNLMLTFPDFRPEDFQPWVNVDDARRAGMEPVAFAADTAHRWKDGLSKWGIVSDRIRWLKGIAEYSIYTPGSDAGLPISILASLAAPKEGWAGNEESLREKINGIVTALLALIGKDARPVQDKEHVLIANIFEFNWAQGISLTLEDIIRQVQKPPFNKLGVLDIDSYMSERARTKLAMELNNIVAAPSFQSWIQGEALDIQNLLYQPNGRARVSIFYIAHLNEAERQFIITLILENMLGWMRQQSGTTSLRALLYIDEMFGYFPPYPRNPPTKEPILRLLKQARAFGLGLILATQNPGDLDYKGLSNAGTWFIGRLQSENDKQRVMAGLESLASADSNLNLRDVEKLVSDLEPRVFVMHNVHDTGGPVVVHSRWCMSYLRGPLTRQQVSILMAGRKQALMQRLGVTGQMQAQIAYPPLAGAPLHQPPPNLPGMPPAIPEFNVAAQAADPVLNQGWTNQATVAPAAVSFTQMRGMDTQATVRGPAAPPGFSNAPPPLPSNVAQYFIPASVTSQQAIEHYVQQTRMLLTGQAGAVLAYQPVLLAQAGIRYQDKKSTVYTTKTYAFHVPSLERSGLVHWENFQTAPVETQRVSGEPFGQALFGELAPGLTDAKRMNALRSEVVDMLYSTARLQIPFNPTLGVYGKVDAPESEFHAAIQQAAREARDQEVDTIAAKYEKEMDKVEDRLRKESRDLEAQKKELADLKREELFTRGEAIISLFKGRTAYTLSRSSRVTRFRRQAGEQLTESEQQIVEYEQALETLQQRFNQEIQTVNERWARVAVEIQPYVISPYKKDIQLELFGIGWVPYFYVQLNGQPLLLQAWY
jgi:septin family protein